MKRLLFGLIVLVYSAAPCRAAGITLSIQDGRVSLDAQDVTIRQILAEWARIGKTRIVNGERLSGDRVTLKLDGVPEKQALDIVLRAVPGYLAAPRVASETDASMYDTILIMATTTTVAPLPAPNSMQRGPLGASGTQLRQPPPPASFAPMEFENPNDQSDDPAIAAAAAAGLIAVPAPPPGTPSFLAPLNLPGANQPRPASAAPATTAPANPWNAPAGTSMPSPATPAPPTTQPTLRPAPPQADR